MATIRTALEGRGEPRKWRSLAIAGTLAASLVGVGFAVDRILDPDATETMRVISPVTHGGMEVGTPSGGFQDPAHHHPRVKWG
jgi:hypothetical protein